MVDKAIDESRDGNVISRVTRDVRGAEENVDVPPEVTYSSQAVQDLVKRVKRSMDKPAQDAKLNFPALTQVKEKPGVSVQAGRLQRRIESTLTVTGEGDREVGVPVKRTEPKVTRAQLAAKYPTLLVVDRNTFQLKLYKKLKLQKGYTVAIGADGFSTPAGLYHIQNKGVNVALERAPEGVGGQPRRHRGARWVAGEPPQGPLDGDHRRRGHPRHRPGRVAGLARLARLRADGDPRRDRAVPEGAGPDADLHRLSAARRRSPRPGLPPIPDLPGRAGARCGECTGCR